jgi:Fic family protein
MVLDIHRLVTDRTLDDLDAAGRVRREDEPVVVSDMYGTVLHTPPAASSLQGRLAAMCDFANGRTPEGFIAPAIRSILLHFWLSYDHPFVDGNGRTARALFYWSMLRHKYWLFEFISISQIILRAPAKYGRAFLYAETDENDLTYFILYHLEVIRRAVVELHEHISRKTQQLQTLEQSLHGTFELNHRQRALLSHALRHPGHGYTVESHRRSHNVVYETARTDLLDLSDRGLLQKVKVGKTWRFTPVPALDRKLTETGGR